MHTLRTLAERGLVRVPNWLPANVQYETQMGSVAYGVSSDTSDVDLYGFCIPPKELIFPHLAGEIPGFGTPSPRFEQFQKHHIRDESECGGTGREYDVTVFSIVRYFQLCMENNPNMVDSLFTPETAVLSSTRIGRIVRDHRRLFLHKGCWAKFRGYAFQQLHKMRIKQPKEGSKRALLVEEFGMDVKFAYHVVRLLDEAEQILEGGDLDLQRDRERLKAIRRGEWSLEQVIEHFEQKSRHLEELYARSPLPPGPDEPRIRQLLLQCLEEHYGSLGDAVARPDAALTALREIRAVLERLPGL